jgi:hypothetical protein
LDSESDIHVGLSKLWVEWNWTEENQASLSGSCGSLEARKACLEAVNPTLGILSTERDVALLRVRAKTKGVGTAFPPKDHVAIPCFVLPGAFVADGSHHAFSIHALKQDLCLGQWNPEIPAFEQLATGTTKRLRGADETTRRAAELALVEIREGFPTDGGRKCLGTRFAEAVHDPVNEEEVAENAVSGP